MTSQGDEAQSEWKELKRLVSQKNGKRMGDYELRWDEDLTGNRVLVLNVVAASFYDGPPQMIRFTAQPQLKSLSPSIHVPVGKGPTAVTWSLAPSTKAGVFAWAIDDDEMEMQKKLATSELAEAIETKLVSYHPPVKAA
jgi:hypothetical protein